MLRPVRAASYLALTLILLPVQAAAVALRWRFAERLPIIYHRLVCRLFGLRVERRGAMRGERPTLFVANHVSYLDIAVLGGIIPGSFVAKSEVRGWPLFGTLARLQRTVFVDRRIRNAARQRDHLTERLEARGNLILFPEGTSNDGNRIAPFKSALFAAAETRVAGDAVVVQPVTIAYVRLDGIPMGRRFRPWFAWYGDMTLAGHLWWVLGIDHADVTVLFHPPVTVGAIASRKALAEHCAKVIADGLAAANSGRLPRTPSPLVAGGTPPATSLVLGPAEGSTS